MRELTDKQIPFFVAFFILVFICFYNRPALGVMVFCLGILIVIAHGLLYVRKIKKRGELTSGHLIDYVYDKDGDATPLIEFETASKEKISGHPYINSSLNFSLMRFNKEKKGQEVNVIYNKEKPSDFILPDDQNSNNLAFGLIILFVITMFGLSIYDLFFGAVF
jgi:hypothetical protein